MCLVSLVEAGDVDDVCERPLHPYVVSPLSAVPDPDPRVRKRRIVLAGDVPSSVNPPSGCRFHPRYRLRKPVGNPEIGWSGRPLFREFGPGHQVACHISEVVVPAAAAATAATSSVAPA